jgi:hypothetical protein
VLALALTHVLQLTGMMQWWTRQTVEVENNMVCVCVLSFEAGG